MCQNYSCNVMKWQKCPCISYVFLYKSIIHITQWVLPSGTKISIHLCMKKSLGMRLWISHDKIQGIKKKKIDCSKYTSKRMLLTISKSYRTAWGGCIVNFYQKIFSRINWHLPLIKVTVYYFFDTPYFYMLYHFHVDQVVVIVVCPWRKAVYLLETSVVLFGAQWFSSLVPVHLLLLTLYIVDAVAFLLVILLTDSFPHIKLAYIALFNLFALNPLVKISDNWTLVQWFLI